MNDDGVVSRVWCVATCSDRNGRRVVWAGNSVLDTEYGGGSGVGIGRRDASSGGGLGSVVR